MRAVATVLAVACALSAHAYDRYVPISGTVGHFSTDARLLNASFEKDIVVNATFLPAGNTDNSGEVPVTLTIPPRQVRVLNDVVETVFGRGVLGAIKLSSADPFEITSRIYARTPEGTQGQSTAGLRLDQALGRGALLQLKSAGSGFRSNIGVLNPNAKPASVTFTLHDKNNKVIRQSTIAVAPLGVIAPTSIDNGAIFGSTANADLSEAWVSYSTDATTPVFAYASVIDNGTQSPTFVAALEDSGTPPAPPTRVIDVTLQNFQVTFSQPLTDLMVGEKVIFRLMNTGGVHGWRVMDPSGTEVIARSLIPENQLTERVFVVEAAGTYTYACSNHCGSGHSSMRGTFVTAPGR